MAIAKLVVWWVCVVVVALLSLALPTSGQGCGTDLSTRVTSFATSNLQCKAYSVYPSNGNQFYIWVLKDNATEVTNMVVGVPLTRGNWAGVGFSSNGRMVGSSALVATFNSNGSAVATVYDLKSQAPSGVVPATGLLSFVGGGAVAYYDQASQYVYMSYKVNLAKSTPVNPSYLLLAYGVQGSSGTTLQQHANAIPVSAEFITGVAAGPSAASNFDKKSKIHASLNILGWGLLLPIGAMVARYARCLDPCWFYTHITFQVVGFACLAAGLATGFQLAKDSTPEHLDAHRGLGVFIFVLAILQLLAAVVRPKKDAKVRKYWNWYHHWVGRLALFLAVVNIFVGLHIADAEHDIRVGYISILSIELGAFAILEILLWLQWNRLRPSQEPAPSEDTPFQFGGSV